MKWASFLAGVSLCALAAGAALVPFLDASGNPGVALPPIEQSVAPTGSAAPPAPAVEPAPPVLPPVFSALTPVAPTGQMNFADPQAVTAAKAPAEKGPQLASLEAPAPLQLEADPEPALTEAIAAYEKGSLSEGDAAARTLTDPAARALAEWIAIRTASRHVGYPRITKFLADHPSWPSAVTVRRRAEEALYLERIDTATVRAFFTGQKPETDEGKIALAQVLLASGDNTAAAALIRDAFRNDPISKSLEDDILKKFPSIVGPADIKFRADRLIYQEEYAEGLRVAARAGEDVLALAKARVAIGKKAGNAAALMKAVPAHLHGDPAYLFAQVEMLRRAGKAAEAAVLLKKAPSDSAALVVPDEWWTERRLVARSLLDKGDARTAYAVAANIQGLGEQARMDQEFHAGWIAFRFLGDAKTGARHFAALSQVAVRPISVARGAYWQGRAAEALGDAAGAKRFYEAAAGHSTTYYGQIARAKLGLGDIALREKPQIAQDAAAAFKMHFGTRAIAMLYRLDRRDYARILALDFAASLEDAQALTMLGELALVNQDTRTALSIGKSAVQRGFPLDFAAFPTNGIPDYQKIHDVERAVVYGIARQESEFSPEVVSHAGARGLMQVMPATAKATAKAASLPFDANRLTSDPAYNAQIGSAHLGELIDKYRGSYIMTFAAYNAGGARVGQWVAAYGDPRDPKVDPVDWVERIPFTETRNYVQRVMENVQVYRAFLDQKTALLIGQDLRRGAR